VSIFFILLVIAFVLVLFDIVLWNAVAAYNRVLLTPIGLLLVIIALFIGSGGIHA
jgi:hypothetical protein